MTHGAGRPFDSEDQEFGKAAPSDVAAWMSVTNGMVTGVDWGKWLGGQRMVDPYLIWADLTGFAGFGGWDSADRQHGGRLPFLVEMRKGASLALGAAASASCRIDDPIACKDVNCVFGLMEIPAVYKLHRDPDLPPADSLRTRYFTARINPCTLPEILKDTTVERLQLGVPRLPATLPDPLTKRIREDKNLPRIVVGIIDDGCAFAHPAFCSPDGRTRVHFLWDQDHRREAGRDGWRLPAGLGYGAELTHAQLSGASRRPARGEAEECAYAQVDYGPIRLDPDEAGSSFSGNSLPYPPGAMLRASHGASAMYLAAGRLAGEATPLRGQRAVASEPPPLAQANDGDDAATRWPIVFVQLPTRTVIDTSGGSLGVHVLDGIRYILERAAQLPNPSKPGSDPRRYLQPHAGSLFPADDSSDASYPDNKVVINISYGALAGPHDGTSIIEQAMADIVNITNLERKKSPIRTCWICCAAGNAHTSRTHARLRLKAGEHKSLLWRVGPDNVGESFLEVWFPDLDSRGDPLRDGIIDQLFVRILPPGGLPELQVRSGEVRICESKQTDVRRRAVAGAVFARRVVQGLRGTMLLVAVGPTRQDMSVAEPAALAPHGDWEIEIGYPSGPGDDPKGPEIVVHAWAERNDLVYGNRRAQQSTLIAHEPVPDLTEFMPETRELIEQQASGARQREDLPDPLEPRYSLGTLAGASRPSSAAFYDYDDSFMGQLVVVGAHRIADGEISDYSSGGPSRHAPDLPGLSGKRSESVPQDAYDNGTRPRGSPDVDAPGDIGPALRGVRVIGMRAGSVSRLSGTSAATPSVARAIASVQYRKAEFDYVRTAGSPQRNFGVDAVRAAAGIGEPEQPLPAAARPTPTPTKDDQFRRGKLRVR